LEAVGEAVARKPVFLPVWKMRSRCWINTTIYYIMITTICIRTLELPSTNKQYMFNHNKQ
jgi:hypothetical protein